MIWSNRCKEIFGLEPNDSVNYQVFLERLHPDDREHTDRVVKSSLDPRGDGGYQIDYRVVWPDGEVRWVVAQGQAIFEGEGEKREAFRFAGIVLDITERKLAEERLREETRVAETLLRIGTTVAGELELDALVQSVTDEATSLTEAEFGAFFYNVRSDEGESYLLYTLSGDNVEVFQQFPMPRNTDIFRPTFAGEGAVRLADAHSPCPPLLAFAVAAGPLRGPRLWASLIVRHSTLIASIALVRISSRVAVGRFHALRLRMPSGHRGLSLADRP